MKIKLYTAAIYFMSALWLGLIIWVVYALTYPFQISEHTVDKIRVLNKTVRPGEVFYLDFKFERLIDGPITVTRILKNDFRQIPLLDVVVDRKKGKYDFVSELTVIPHDISSGQYVLEYGFSKQVNPIRHVTQRIETEPFIVGLKRIEECPKK